MIVSPDVPEAAAAVTHHQFFTIMVPLGLILLGLFVFEEISARAGKPGWRESKIVVWLDRNIVAIRSVFIVLLVSFYAYEAAWWFNMDMFELNTIAVGGAQVGKEFQRRADLIQNLDTIVNNYARHEWVLFEHVSDMRAQLQAMQMAGGAPSAAQGARLEQAFMNLSALAEQYPDLKAEQRFRELMDMAEVTENRIAEQLDIYLESILAYDACNQCFWCNYWTYLVAPIVPLPAYWEYYHTDHPYAPVVPVEAMLGKVE